MLCLIWMKPRNDLYVRPKIAAAPRCDVDGLPVSPGPEEATHVLVMHVSGVWRDFSRLPSAFGPACPAGHRAFVPGADHRRPRPSHPRRACRLAHRTASTTAG